MNPLEQAIEEIAVKLFNEMKKPIDEEFASLKEEIRMLNKELATLDKPLKAKELAEKLSVSTVTVHYWVKKGCPRHIKSEGGNPYYILREVLDWRTNNSQIKSLKSCK